MLRIAPTKSEDDVVSEVEDYGLKEKIMSKVALIVSRPC